MNLDFIKDSPRACTTEKYWRENHGEIYRKIMSFPGTKFPERLYNYAHCCPDHLCPVCGKNTEFISYMKGYRKYCSNTCATKDGERNKAISKKNRASASEAKIKRECTNKELYGTAHPQTLEEIKQKTKQTNLQKYGTISPLQNKEIKQKTKQTNLQKYGVEHASQSDAFKSKFKATSIAHYGVDNPNKSEIIKQKTKQTNLRKYGVEHVVQCDAIKQKIKKTMMDRYGAPTWAQGKMRNEEVLRILEDGRLVMRCPHLNCGKCKERCYITTSQINYDRKKIGTECCTILHPIQSSHSKNTGGEIFIQHILDSHGVEYQKNYRGLGFELDIYIPQKKIAIEFNGYRWHSTKYKTKKYHIDKYKKCEEQGIQLLSIWEDWVLRKPEIVESLIKSKLGIYKTRIGARECMLKDVPVKEAEEFLENMHIQGTCHSTIKKGLYYHGELVSLMTFGKRRPGMGRRENEWELLRFCNKLDVQVMGGASKLLKAFIQQIRPTKIISFSSNDISSGSLYKTLGFKNTSESLSYWYINSKDGKRYHRFTFTKQNILRKGMATDVNKTEEEMMYDAGFYKIWDSGTKKWEL